MYDVSEPEAEAIAGMPRWKWRWKWHKEVQADKITSIKYLEGGGAKLNLLNGDDPVLVDDEWLNKHPPEVNGYFVVYADGYSSFSPAKAFEEGYTKISGDWRDRVAVEKRELDEKIKRLQEFFGKPTMKELSAPVIVLLRLQLYHMQHYSTLLGQRLAEN